MAKPDMSGNKGLAGKTVSRAATTSAITRNGYATSAIKTGSKTGKAAAPSADTVSGGGGDRGSYGGSVYDQEHFSDDELRSAAEVGQQRRQAKRPGQTPTTMWSIRSNLRYSGDSDGSRHPLEMGGGGRRNRRRLLLREAAPTYTSRYQSQIDDLTRQILNREAFSYDPGRTPPISSTKEATRATASGRCRTPWGRSAPAQAALQAAMRAAQRNRPDSFMGALADKIRLKQLAYSMYQDEGNTQRANLEMLEALEQSDYAKYADLLAQYNTDRSFDYGVHRDNISDSATTTSGTIPWAGTRSRTSATGDETAYNRETYKDETEYNRALAKAQTLAASGDFSGYKALGDTDQEIAGLKSAYNKRRHPLAPAAGPQRRSPAEARAAAQAPARTCTQEGARRASAARRRIRLLLSAGYNTPRPESWPGITPTG